jgi:hypothetical protein
MALAPRKTGVAPIGVHRVGVASVAPVTCAEMSEFGQICKKE